MKALTMLKVAQSIQLLKLDGNHEFTNAQLSRVSGVSAKTLQRNAQIIKILEFALNSKEYHQCIVYI
jgi:hypothetical protein